MNARALALWSAAALTVALSSANPVYRALVLVASLNVLLALRRPGVRLRPLLLVMAVGGASALLVTFAVSHTGAHVLWTLPEGVPVLGGRFTVESLVFGAVSGLGISAAVVSVAPLSLVAAPHELLDALPRALARSGAAVATALNLLPALARSATEIRDAQRMRGVRVARLAGARHVALPVVLTAVEDSVRLAEAMEARAYANGPRTHYGAMRWTAGDVAVAVLAALAAAVFVVLRATGTVPDWYPFPTLTAPSVHPLAVIACLALAAPALRSRR